MQSGGEIGTGLRMMRSQGDPQGRVAAFMVDVDAVDGGCGDCLVPGASTSTVTVPRPLSGGHMPGWPRWAPDLVSSPLPELSGAAEPREPSGYLNSRGPSMLLNITHHSSHTHAAHRAQSDTPAPPASRRAPAHRPPPPTGQAPPRRRRVRPPAHVPRLAVRDGARPRRRPRPARVEERRSACELC